MTVVHRLSISALAFALVAMGCDDAVPLDTGDDYEIVVDMRPGPITAIDVLLVVDDSNGMFHQESFGVAVGDELLTGMDLSERGPFDWHVAVVSTDMGTGAHGADTGCLEDGDDGHFQAVGLDEGSYLVDVAAGGGARDRNFSDDRSDVLRWSTDLGVGGCGFEQPLASMRRALERSEAEGNGFLRDDALLAVLILADEDDCSAFDDGVYSGAQDSLDSELGPLASFRCFEFGVVCDGDDDPRSPGTRSGCRPRDDSPYIEPVEGYVQLLESLRPGSVFVATLTGGPEPVAVSLGGPEGTPRLEPSCTSRSQPPAAPAVRLAAFADSFPERNLQSSICAEDLGPALAAAADLLGGMSEGKDRACFQGDFTDVADEPGIQPRCRALATPRAGHAQQEPLAVCTDERTNDCVAISASSSCRGFEAVLHGDVVPEGWRLVVECTSQSEP